MVIFSEARTAIIITIIIITKMRENRNSFMFSEMKCLQRICNARYVNTNDTKIQF